MIQKFEDALKILRKALPIAGNLLPFCCPLRVHSGALHCIWRGIPTRRKSTRQMRNGLKKSKLKKMPRRGIEPLSKV